MNLVLPRLGIRLVVTGGVLCICIGGAAQDIAWLKQNRRSAPERYEGLVDQPNARREYDVLGFLAYTSDGPAKLPKDEPVILSVQYCRPKTIPVVVPGPNTAFIEVQQLNSRVHYLMKASQTPASKSDFGWKSFSWPTKDVINRYDIDPNNLGVVIHWGQDNEYAEDIEPAVLGVAPAWPQERREPGRIQRYTLMLRVWPTLRDLSYEIRSKGGPTKVCYYENEFSPCVQMKPKELAPIESGSLVQLNLDMSNMPDGETLVHIDGNYGNSDDKLTANFRFMHESTCR
jgi:hypothetical protein